jgi:folate-dependent phosphoribosylglycinamide formyltransferase PurN
MQTGLAECCLLIIKNEVINEPKTIFQKLTQPHVFFEQFKKHKLNPTLYNSIPAAFPDNIQKLWVSPNKIGKFSEEFSADDVQIIKSKQLDLIIRFGFGILKGEVLNSAKWGIWSFHHGNEQEFRGGPPGFWEIMKGRKTQGVILQQLGEKLDAGKIILKREYAVISHSYIENITKLLLQSTDMPAQALKMIANDCLPMNEIHPIPTKAPVYKYPSNLQFLKFLLVILLNKIKFSWMRLMMQENWIIGYRLLKEKKYHFIAPPRDGEYYADPFTFCDQDKNYIVAEHYSYRTKKGSIVLIEPGQNQTKTIIEKDTHLSYPFIFEENGITYLMPEESNAGKLNLYKWNPISKTFDFYRTILELPCIDASIVKNEGLYYIFLGLKGLLPNEKLFIYHSTQLEGPYIPHTANPVKVSPAGSRMAGAFYYQNNMLMRPSQYSVKYYGEKVVLQQVKQLSASIYQEEVHSELLPFKDSHFNDGLHNYHKSDHLEVVDLKKMRSGWVSFKAQL